VFVGLPVCMEWEAVRTCIHQGSYMIIRILRRLVALRGVYWCAYVRLYPFLPGIFSEV